MSRTASVSLRSRTGTSCSRTVTGTGCMSSAITGCFLAVAPDRPLEAAAEALVAFGVAGEDAAQGAKGPGHRSTSTSTTRSTTSIPGRSTSGRGSRDEAARDRHRHRDRPRRGRGRRDRRPAAAEGSGDRGGRRGGTAVPRLCRRSSSSTTTSRRRSRWMPTACISAGTTRAPSGRSSRPAPRDLRVERRGGAGRSDGRRGVHRRRSRLGDAVEAGRRSADRARGPGGDLRARSRFRSLRSEGSMRRTPRACLDAGAAGVAVVTGRLGCGGRRVRLSELGELGLLAELERRGLAQGIENDAAQLAGGLIVTQDALVESVHFRLDLVSWRDLGFRAAAVNLSDLAASGADPRGPRRHARRCPARRSLDDVLALYEGLNEPGVPVVGGDTSRAERVMLSVTALGRSERVPAARRTARRRPRHHRPARRRRRRVPAEPPDAASSSSRGGQGAGASRPRAARHLRRSRAWTRATWPSARASAA